MQAGLAEVMKAEVQPDLRITRQPCGPRNVQLSASCPPALMRPGLWKVEDFDLHRQLYKGKASLLYSASCRRCNMPVAVKVYRKARLSELNWYQVEREVRIHSSLDHKNIIRLYAAFEDDSNVYMVQEYATGGDLYEDLRRRGGKYEEAVTAAGVLKPCIEALMYLHSKGIIHRDIKPENILLMADRSIKLADFGLSIDATFERPVTRAGTLDYMAPEVLLCPEKSRPQENKDKVLLGYTAMVDAWAMGILAYELVVGRPPFEKTSRAATYEHIMYRKPECPANMSADAKDFVFSALTKAARKRPALTDLLSHPWLQSGCANTLTGPLQTPASAQGSTATAPHNSPALATPQASIALTQESGITTPGVSEGKHGQHGLSPSTTSSDETIVTCDPAGPSLQHSDSRGASVMLNASAGLEASGAPDRAGPPPFSPSSSKKKKSNDEGDRQTTWTASLKRGMLRMLSKTPSGRSQSIADPQATPPMTSPTSSFGASAASPNDQALRSAGLSDQHDVSLNSWASLAGNRAYKPRLTGSSKQSPNTTPSPLTLLNPIVSRTQNEKDTRPMPLSPDPSVRGTKSTDVNLGAFQVRSRAANAASPFGTEVAQTRPFTNPKGPLFGKPKQMSAELVEESDPLLRGPSTGPLPTALSLSRVSPVPATSAAAMPRVTSSPPSSLHPSFTNTPVTPPHRLIPVSGQLSGLTCASIPVPQQQQQQPPQQQQSGQTVQQMLTAMRQSSRRLSSPRPASNDAAAADVGTSHSGGIRAAARATALSQSPFHSALSEKDFAQDISRRYAMGGTNGTANAGCPPADELRGATSVPISIKHKTAQAYLRAHGAGNSQAGEVGEDDFNNSSQLSRLSERSAQLMKRSQSFALPASMVIEPGARSASNRQNLKRSEIASRPQTHLFLDQAAPPSQKKPVNLAPRPRLNGQQLEPSLSTSWGNGKGLASYNVSESPRIKAGMA